ncbi:hypothetical protein GCM10023196_103050 [Actinoallomurus vinaceus]|uniref:CHAT domain-containing protein n=1 Tax=Actinoallomurus vinaceus TaxID=1080074 RepID=A0ABP8UXJ6_9ACTN
MRCDFEVEILRGGIGEYQVNVLSSPAGGTSGRLRLDTNALLARRRELQSVVLASAVTSRAHDSTAEGPVRDIGNVLFSALFNGPVYGRYAGSLAAAAERGESLRVVLRLQDPELAALPWETMFDSENDIYVCQAEPILRYMTVPSATHPLHIDPPLRILGMTASPSDLCPLDVAEEQRRLSEVLAGLGGQVELVWADGGGWMDLQRKLLAGPWHVVHFIGHGGFRGGAGVLALVGPGGTADHVSASRFTTLLSTAAPQPRLVVLNSCSSGETGVEDLFSSTAAALVRSGVQAAVAMQFAISDPAATAFAGGFYSGVVGNRAISEAVRIGRIAIIGSGADTLEWVTPVLYLRGEDSPLFTVSGAKPETATGSPEETGQTAALRANYIQALGELRHHDYEAAITLLNGVLTLDPGYRDAAERRDRARAALRAAKAFERGQAAERNGEWDAAIRSYATVIEQDPEHPEAFIRRDDCLRGQRIADLEAERRLYEDLGNERVADEVSAELEALRSPPSAHPPHGAPPPPPEGVTGTGGVSGTPPPSVAGRPSPRRRASRRRWAAVPLVLLVALGLYGIVSAYQKSHDPDRRLWSYIGMTPYAADCEKGPSNHADGILAQASCSEDFPVLFQLFTSTRAMDDYAKRGGRRWECHAKRPPRVGEKIWQSHSGNLTGILSCEARTTRGSKHQYIYCATADQFRLRFCLYGGENVSAYDAMMPMSKRVNTILDELRK